jgi:L-ascorbate metabolism protein UlaG (beta-lactamase superfamily)
VVELPAAARRRFDAVTVEAVPARHWMTPGGPRAQPQGYLVDGGPRIWFAGDTGRFDGLRELAGRVDVALMPVWTWGPHLGPGHLGPRSAAEVLATIGAPLAIPIHWGTLYPRRLHRIWRSPLAEPGDRFAVHAARIAPGSQVRVLRPGESVSVRDSDLRPRTAAG